MGLIEVPGYASIFLSIGLIGAINIFSLGLIGSYAWRTYENTKGRPLSIILKIDEFN
jgi:nicotinamide riboside transporter PnuC